MRACAMVMAVLVAANGFAQEFAGYSTEPLLGEPAVPYPAVPDRLERYTARLEKEYPTLSTAKYPETRERGFAFVDAIIKQRAIENRPDFTEFDCEALHAVFAWGAKLGAFGADLVSTHFAREGDPASARGPEPPSSFRVVLEYPHYIVSTQDAAWRLRIPFYFPIENLERIGMDTGRSMSAVSVRTSFGRLDAGGGLQPASIIFIYSPETDPAALATMLLKRYGMSPLHEADSPMPNAHNYRIDELRLNMRIELTVLHNERGSYAFVYMGRNGTYEANRVNYLDFMRLAELNAAE